MRENCGKIAVRENTCCGPVPSCGCGYANTQHTFSKAMGYSDEELNAVPEGANLGLGCGHPTALASWVYFKKFRYTTPLKTAIIFMTFVVLVDFFVVALLINRSLEMFSHWLGTWFPFALIFISTYLTGLTMKKYSYSKGAAKQGTYSL